jgi:hypothetical protein
MTQPRGSAHHLTLNRSRRPSSPTVFAISAQCLTSLADPVQANITTHVLNTRPRADVKPMDRYPWFSFPWRRKSLLVLKPDAPTGEQTTHGAGVASNDRDGDGDNIGIKVLYDPTDVQVEPEVE